MALFPIRWNERHSTFNMTGNSTYNTQTDSWLPYDRFPSEIKKDNELPKELHCLKYELYYFVIIVMHFYYVSLLSVFYDCTKDSTSA